MHEEHLKDLSEFLSELDNETDRGLALVGAAFLDDILKRSLHSLMQGNESANEKSLLRSGGPLGDATVRLDLCLALGIISEDEHHELSNVYKIRNKFGHRISYKSFDNGGDTAISDLVANLQQGGPPGTGYSRRSRFQTSVIVLALHLWYRPDWVQKVRVQEPLFSRIHQATKLQGIHPMGATKPD